MGIFSRRQTGTTATVEPAPAGGVALDSALRELTGQWTIDRPHSRVGFSVRHAMVTTVRGAFADYDSTLYFDGDRPSASRA